MRCSASSCSRNSSGAKLAARISTCRFTALKAWRAEVAREHNLPAYVIFHDATLAAIAALGPQKLDDLSLVSGIGARKLEAYGAEVLRVSLQNS